MEIAKKLKDHIELNNEVLVEYDTTGFLNMEKEAEATRVYFHTSVNKRMHSYIDTEDKLKYLVENGYYEKEFLEKYSKKFINLIFKKAYSYKHRFPNFMSASKFYEKYALKSRDGKEILERYEDRCAIASLYLADGNEVLAMRNINALMTSGQPATPTFMNAGKMARGELVSCFKLDVDDSRLAIGEVYKYCLELSSLGGGVGINLTNIRPLGDPIKGNENAASGVIPVAKQYELAFNYANQLGQRDGSGVVYLHLNHADIEAFISAKKPNADEKTSLSSLSTGIIIPGIFFKLMRQNKDFVLFSPYDIKKEYGINMSDMDMSKMYYELLDNPNIRNIKRVNARRLYNEIKKTQAESGYPFELFDDNVNNAHALKGLGRVKMSNLCTEILQYQTTSIITDADEENKYGFDVSCNLSSLDIRRATQDEDFAKLVDTMMRMLTAVSVKTSIKNVPSVKQANEEMCSVGLGAMNLHGHLAQSLIQYGSGESVIFTDLFFEALNYYSLKSSMEQAKETGKKFFGFDKSEYANGEYFKDYVTKVIKPIPKKVKAALGNVPIITAAMWKELKADVMEHGVRNAYRLAVAPTGSISYIRSCTASIAPIIEQVEIRDYRDSRTIYAMPGLTNENKHLYVSAYDMDMCRMIDVYAAAQRHVDQGISMTVYFKDTATTSEVARAYMYAHEKGIKTVYYVRMKLSNIEKHLEKIKQDAEEGCESCAV